MFLIMSAAYVGQDLRAEFGSIPPAFLPLGNRRLFQHQVAKVPQGKSIYLSVPKSYPVQEFDRLWLEEHNVTLLPLPDNLSLGESLMAALALIEHSFDTDLSILYGDTLITPPSTQDVVSISKTDSTYNWATVDEGKPEWLDTEGANIGVHSQVVSGYFNFASPRTLIRCLSQTHWNFLQALSLYHDINGIQTCQCDDWLDFGHINTYYRSKALYTTQRAFNELTITADWIEKSSAKDKKIAAESNWFKTLPSSLKHFAPQYLGEKKVDKRTAYRLEYLYNIALNELFVFAHLPEMTWKQILDQMLSFLSSCQKEKAPLDAATDSLDSLFSGKTEQRLQEFCQDRSYDWELPWCFNGKASLSLKALYEATLDDIPKGQQPSLMHGDFCFSNILYDFRKDRIKVIDPRGITSSNIQSIYGHIQYDIAKICHSVIGLYDWIIAGYYHVDTHDYRVNFSLADTEHLTGIQQMFIDALTKHYALSESALYAMQIQLFLSMLPLHSDDPERQDALMANAYRLYYLMLENKK
ncbi:capsular polysaccharide biosynthesis protein [Vibrio chagasii]|nr:capsular polysaccharide biosynthesis protein [Vibrio chagasii]CAH6910699.1 capsular polysaccharide biosynthesis protein [Vibrio chagasii]